MLRWKSSLKPAAAAPPTDITLEDSAVTTGVDYSAPTDIDVNIPAVSINDILLLLCTTNDLSDPTSSPPAGWTKIAEQDGSTTSISTVAAYWKRASSSASATTETWSAFYSGGEVHYIWVGAYSGCVTSGSPVDAYGSSAIGYGSPWSVNVTTTTADTMIVTISGNTRTDTTHTWSDGTELIDTIYGSSASVSINEKLEATTGSKTRTVTPSLTTGNSMIAVALKPDGGGGGGTSPGTTNLLAWYEMNDASGGAVDSHSGSYDLTENGTPLYAQTGVNGNAIDFDGSTDYFSLASTFGWSEAYPFSFSAHFKTSSASTQTISQMTAPGAQGKYVLMTVQADGEVSAYVRNGTIQSITSSGAGVGDGAWHHLVATFVSATERYLYLDGVQVAGSASETSQAINTDMSEIRVGADQSNGVSNYFNGLLDEVAFWSDELTLNEITWLYNSGSGRSYSAVSGGSTYAYGPEGFEGTGAPTGFTSTIVGSGTVDYDDTSDSGTGLQSLEVVTSGGDSYAELDLGAEYSNFTLIWQEKRIGGGSNRSWMKMSPSSGFATNTTATIGNSSWEWRFSQNSSNLIPTTNNVSTTAWHYVKLEIDRASTSVTITKSTSSDFSSPDTNTSSSFPFHSNFTGVRYLRFGGINKDHTILIDELSLEDNS